jgi:hypothetical protein
MAEPVTVRNTPTGVQSLLRVREFMSQYKATDDLDALMIELPSEAFRLIQEVPVRPVCQELAVLGIYQYSQLNLLDKYKVLYRYDEREATVYIVAFLRQKQSAERLLVDLSLNR